MAKWGEIKCPRCAELEAKLDRAEEFIIKLKHYAIAMDDRYLHANTAATLAELRSDLPVDETRESQKGQGDG